MKKPTLLAIGLTAALLLTGCAGNAGASSSADGAGSDEPILIGNIEALTGVVGVDSQAPQGAIAAAKAINAAGGVNGRSIEIVSCDSASDPNTFQKCVRDASDEGVVGFAGNFDALNQQSGLEVAEGLGLPWVAPTAMTEAEFTSPVSFPVTTGAVGSGYGLAPVALELGCKHVGTWTDPAVDPTISNVLKDALEAEGVKYTAGHISNSSTADVTPAVQEVVDANPDCLVFLGANFVAAQIFTAARKLNSDAQFVSALGTMLPAVVTSVGSVAEGLASVSDAPLPSIDDLDEFRDDLAKYTDVKPEEANQFGLAAWYGVHIIAEALKEVDDPSAETLLGSLNEMKDVELPGLPKMDFTQTMKSERFARMFNPAVQIAVVEDGVYVPSDAGWQDITDLLP